MMWNALSQPQATVIGAAITGCFALAAIWLGTRFFSGKVRSIEAAIRESQGLVDGHLADMDGTLLKLRDTGDQLNSVISAMSEQVGRIEAVQSDTQNDIAAEEDIPAVDGEVGEEDGRKKIRSLWEEIRDHLEAVASQPKIDGRTRAKYMRIDRRQYDLFIDSLEKGDLFSAQVAQKAKAAFVMRNRFRRRFQDPTPEEIATMIDLRDTVLNVPVQHDD